jgi:hypothetical protein
VSPEAAAIIDRLSQLAGADQSSVLNRIVSEWASGIK